jgi:diguanylate cyclase (GGDEF)-like protein
MYNGNPDIFVPAFDRSFPDGCRTVVNAPPTILMPEITPNLENFTDSAYARELRRGPANMRFEARLEAAYRLEHLRRVRTRVRIWHSVNIALVVLFTGDQVRRNGIFDALALAHVCALVPCALTLVWLAWSRQYERLYLRFGGVLIPMFGALIAAFVAIAVAGGHYEQLGNLMVILFGGFFFAGLLLPQAVLATISTMLAFGYAAYWVGLPFALCMKSTAIMAVAAGIAAFVYRDVERAYRRNFLESALIGELVVRDGLSGLMNRRAFDEHFLFVCHQAMRERRSVALFMVDIDHFKGYNDQWGHQAGDRALRGVAAAISGLARRPLDLAARFGGDEFAVILYDLEFSHAQYLAERLRESVQSLGSGTEIWNSPEVTVSVGVGFAVPGTSNNSDGILKLADEALYEAKRAGRNRVIAKGATAHVFLNTGEFAKAHSLETPEPTE